MKSSPEPIWKQHRRFKEEKEREKEKGGGGTSGLSESSASKSPSGAPAAGGNRDSQSQIQTGRKLTHRLGKASAEGKFNKDEVLEVLQKVRLVVRTVEGGTEQSWTVCGRGGGRGRGFKSWYFFQMVVLGSMHPMASPCIVMNGFRLTCRVAREASAAPANGE